MTACVGRLNALVIFVFPGGQGATLVQACWSSGPARWWIALSTPDPRIRLSFAEFTNRYDIDGDVGYVLLAQCDFVEDPG